MDNDPIDDYLSALEEPMRSTLTDLRAMIRDLLPGAEECLAYGAPAFIVDGAKVAGFAAFKHHLSYLPHSGAVLTELGDDVATYETSKGALKFPIDAPLPRAIVEQLVNARLRELAAE